MFSKKKQEESGNLESTTPKNTLSNDPATSKDNYGEQDNNETFVNTAGKIGKAQHNYLREVQKVQTTNQNRAISALELAEHKSAHSAWLSLNGVVYDVTNYMKYHPGGKLILQGCGKECSDLFNKYHPWVNGQFLLKKFKLGYLAR